MLTSLRLTGFKNFRDAALNMGPFTLLVGANASGKSNLRDAFRFLHGIARGYSLAEIIGEKYGEGGERVWRGIRGGTQEIVFSGDYLFALDTMISDHSGSPVLGYLIAIGIVQGIVPPNVIAESLISGNKKIFESKIADIDKPVLSWAEKHTNHIHLLPISGGGIRFGKYSMNYSNHRPALTQLVEESAITEEIVIGACKEALSAFASMRFFDLDPEALRRPSIPGQTILGDKGENLSSVLQAICQQPESKAALLSWIAELTPMDAVDFEFPADFTGRILLTLVERNGQRISAYSASDGTLRFLAMIAALLGPHPSRFYFFEELDNGIHPARLHLLLSLIERQAALGKVQVVATTHSPQVLSLLSRNTLKHAALIYRLPNSPEGRIKRILDIPGAAEIIEKQDIARLHATGWLEDAAYFTSDEDTAA